jgi:catechol 2,3-dioxygenase-like lactoylglutathione lyase family enzyme
MTLDPRVDIGHVHLEVADIQRSLDFSCVVLGFELQQCMGDRRHLSPPAATTTPRVLERAGKDT